MKVATIARPLADRVLIRPLLAPEKSEGGIYIPDSAREKQFVGEVVEVGPGRKLDDGTREQMDVVAGQTVIYSRYAVADIELDGEEFAVVRESDILAITE